MQYSKIKNDPSLLRDEDSGAVITTDKHGLAAYREQRAIKLARMQQQDNLSKRQDKLENDLIEIKNLLIELVGRK